MSRSRIMWARVIYKISDLGHIMGHSLLPLIFILTVNRVIGMIRGKSSSVSRHPDFTPFDLRLAFFQSDLYTVHFHLRLDQSPLLFSGLDPQYPRRIPRLAAFLLSCADSTGWLSGRMPDLNTENPRTVSILHPWISIRVDTVKHVRKDFWPDFVRASGVAALGEVLHGGM